MKFIKFLFSLFLFISTLFLFISCANRKSPTGGEKDIKGPEIVSSIPANKVLNFEGNKLFFEFDEYIKEDNLAQKIIISPALDSTFTHKIVKKKLTLTFNKKLKENTTYTINMGEGIKDITEGNPGNNLKFIFSTGPFIDSLYISGKILELETGKPVKDALIGLYHANDTITPFNGKPVYISRTNETGDFTLENLREDDYLIYSFLDKNRDLKYSNPSEIIGFLDDTIKLDSNIKDLVIPLQKFDLRKLRTLRNVSEKGNVSIELNKGITDVNLSFPTDTAKKVLYTFSDSRNGLTLFNTIQKYDSLPIHLQATDSFDIKLDTTFNILFVEEEIKQTRKGKEEKESKNFSLKISPSNKNILSTKEVEVSSEFPIIKYDLDSIYFYRDSATVYKLDSIDLDWNKNLTSFQIIKDIPFGDTIYFRINRGALLNVNSDSNSLAKVTFLKKKSDKYSTIGGSVDIKADNFIIQLIKKEKSSKILELKNRRNFKFDYLEPGTYSLRVLVDENNNGQWDRGDLLKRVEPEKIIFYYLTDGQGNPTNEIVLKANWELLDNLIKE